MLGLVVHCGEDIHVTLDNVAVVPGFAFENAFSIRQLSAEGEVIMHATGVSALNGEQYFGNRRWHFSILVIALRLELPASHESLAYLIPCAVSFVVVLTCGVSLWGLQTGMLVDAFG